MPKFPAYPGRPVPKILSVLNPLHYWLAFKWMFFQHSQLNHYLYQADSDLYRARGLNAVRQTLRHPSYRNLYLIAVGVTIISAIGAAWLVSVAQATPIRLGAWALGVVLGVAFGAALGAAGGAAFGVAGGAAFGVAFGWALGVALGLALGAAGGVAVGVAAGMTSGVVIGVAAGAVGSVTWGVALSLAAGIVLSTGAGVAVGVILSVASVAGGVELGIVGGVAVGVAWIVCVTRAIFYPFEWLWVWLSALLVPDQPKRLMLHPAVWDELALWPLPRLHHLLQQSAAIDFDATLSVAIRVAANPFQRWAVQRALDQLVQIGSLDLLYHLVYLPILDEYLIAPIRHGQFRDLPSTRTVLLGELGQVFVDSTGGISETSERIAWGLTRRLRRMQPTPISQFAAMLYELARDEDELENVELSEINLATRFAANYEAVRTLPHGAEVTGSFAAFAAFLDFQSIADIASASHYLAWLADVGDLPVRPAIVETFKALADLGTQAQAAERATSPNQKAAALNLAAGALEELAAYVSANVQAPERVLLKRVVQAWQSIVANAQGQLGANALQNMTARLRQESGLELNRQSAVWQHPLVAIKNPYVAGNPVTGALFVGRASILNRISGVWSAKSHPDSIILYGHRRMGKSSLLRNLDQAEPDSAIVYVDLAGETSFVDSTADLLWGLANKLHSTVRRAYPHASLTPPDSAAYITASKAQIQFDLLAEQIRDIVQPRSVILALDEFEAVDKAVAAGKIGPDIYQFLRTKTQDPLFAFVLGGLHTLDEMSRDYQQPFYGSYVNIRVSYLSHADAWRLITNPTPDFDLNYEPAAAERIIAETGGQPYLVQQLCRAALDHLTAELFDEHQARDVLITLADVAAVLGPDFFTRGTVYFDGVWSQTTHADQRTLLQVMAQRDDEWPLSELATTTRLTPEALRAALRWAEHHDILQKTSEEAWRFHVPLMRRWIHEKN